MVFDFVCAEVDILSYRDSEDFRLLCARAEDLCARAAGEICATTFLNPGEQYFLSQYLNSAGHAGRTAFFGGAPGAQRRKLFVFPEYIAQLADGGDLLQTALDFLGADALDEIRALKIRGGGFRDFSHRDYLGALLSLGVERSAVGDIAPIDAYSAYVFVGRKIENFLLETELRIANDRVRVERAALPFGYRIEQRFLEISDTVASARLDCVTAALCHLSREAAKAKIVSGDVELNYEPVCEGSREVRENDVLTVRGTGKFCIEHIGDPTKKGRFRLTAKKYL